MDEHYEASLFWANRGLYITFKTSKVFPSLATETLAVSSLHDTEENSEVIKHKIATVIKST